MATILQSIGLWVVARPRNVIITLAVGLAVDLVLRLR